MKHHSWALIAVLTMAAGCDFPGRPRAADRPVPENQVTDFATLYRRNCAGCHGAEGKLGPAPPLNDAVFLAIVPDSVLARVIAQGRPGTPMPAFARDKGGTLSSVQVQALAAGLKPRWGGPQPLAGPEPLPPYAAAGGTASGANERGGRVFQRACAGCHGDHGEGSKDGAGAINNAAFLALISDDVLRRLAITGRPDLGMPNFAGKAGRPDDFQPLTPAEIDDLVTFVLGWRAPESAGGE